MTKIRKAALGALVAVTIAGCSTTTEQAKTGPSSAPSTSETGSSAAKPAQAQAQVPTINQYIVDNKISEVPFKKDEPGTPKIDFPFPPDWRPAGDRTPDWAYGAIIYDKAPDQENPPFIYAIASRLTGNVDPATVLKLAPSQLNGLPGFVPLGEPHSDKVGGYDAVDYVGNFVWEGTKRAVGQQTIVIPDKDTVFVMQLNAQAPKGLEQPVIDAIKLIREQTKITLPS